MNKKLLIIFLTAILALAFFSVTPAVAAENGYHKDTPAQSIIKTQEIYPDFIKDGMTQPTFTYSNANNPETNTSTIFEEVWIEVPCDTDENGTRDLVRAQILRPAETGVIVNAATGETKISVPVLMLHSPYNNRATTRPIPLWNVWKDLQVNPATTDYTYFEDIQTTKPRTPQWSWSIGAKYWDTNEEKWVDDADFGKPEANPSWYVTPRAGANNAAWFIPASRGDKEVVFRGNWPATISSPGATYQYFYTRGYAIVTSASLGNDFNETGWEGFNNCGNVEETLAPMAIINWLSGDPSVKAYTDRNATKEVVATWCNGNVSMTGTSYDGTLPEATACSGVEGLKAIMPVAAISSWYDYYRGNGAVIAPHGWQGEDADYLSARCFSQSVIPPAYQAYLDEMKTAKARESGDYNSFWDDRNYLTTVESVREDCGIMIMHGLNDWNVKTTHADQFYRALKDHDKTVKEVWHLGAHSVDWNKTDSHYMEYFHLWMDRFLYLLDNGAEDIIPEVSIPNNNNVNWEFYDEWPIAGSTRTTFYMDVPGEDKAGALLDEAPETNVLGTFQDDRVANAAVTTEYDTPPTSSDYNRSGIVSGQLTNWENRLFNPADIDLPSSERLAFATEPLTEPIRINGTVTVGLELSSDIGWGTISAALVEVGPNYRSFSTVSAGSIPGVNGTGAINRNNYTISNTLSQYKIVTRGHVDLQNPNPAQTETYLNAKAEHGYIPDYYFRTQVITPGEKNKYYFEFEPMDYTFKAGTRLAVYVYSSDYRDTQVAKTIVPTFTLYSGPSTFVELPIVPTYSIYYDPNGATSAYAPNGFSDAYVQAGQSKNALNFQDKIGYRVVSPTTAKFTWSEYPFIGWNTRADNTGTTYMPGDIIPDGALKGNITLYAQWEGQPRSNFQLKTDANLIKAGQYFRMYPHFRDAVATNAATLDFTFDKDIFEYRNFTPAEGVQLLQWTTTADGVKLTVMARDYNVTDFGEVLFSAKEDVDLKDEDNEITVSANYVLKLEDGTKEVKNEIASTVFTTIGGDPDLDLILLSDLIDVFGMKYNHPDWAKYKFYDFNKSGDIDIYDVCEVARRIGSK